MDINYFELLIMAYAGLIAAVVSVVWGKADKAEKTSENNKILLVHLSKNVDKTNEMSARLSSLEASVNVEIKNLSISMKRLESAVLRISSK